MPAAQAICLTRQLLNPAVPSLESGVVLGHLALVVPVLQMGIVIIHTLPCCWIIITYLLLGFGEAKKYSFSPGIFGTRLTQTLAGGRPSLHVAGWKGACPEGTTLGTVIPAANSTSPGSPFSSPGSGERIRKRIGGALPQWTLQQWGEKCSPDI